MGEIRAFAEQLAQTLARVGYRRLACADDEIVLRRNEPANPVIALVSGLAFLLQNRRRQQVVIKFLPDYRGANIMLVIGEAPARTIEVLHGLNSRPPDDGTKHRDISR